MSFVLNVVNAPANTNTDPDRKQVDWDARTKYMVEKAGTQDGPESLIGIVTGLIDLGLQKQEDAKMKFTGDADAEAAELAKNPLQYFETLPDDNGVPTRYKRWKVKPAQQVALTIDFGDIMLNQSQFFDEVDSGEEHPLRMLMNNEFYMKGVGKIVGKMYGLKESRNDDGTWGIKSNTILYKLAQACGGVLDSKANLKPAYLGNLLGKAALFEVQLFTNTYDGKEYLNEKVKLSGQVPKAMQKLIPTIDQSYIYGVNFTGEQNPEVLKNLRQSVINTMQLAVNFAGSDLESALIALGRVKAGGAETDQAAATTTAKPLVKAEVPMVKTTPAPKPDFDSFDDDIPFAPIGLQEGRMFLHMI